ncbi:MAG: SRPBCC domain-containing protein [Planctomycetaceae bacterium]
MTPFSGTRIEMIREFTARRELVFQAMSNAKFVQRWFFPRRDVVLVIDQFDFAMKGRYRFRYHFPDGTISKVNGQFLKIVRNESVEFTWTWEPPDPHANVQTLVTWQLEDLPSGTRLFVTHEQLPDDYIQMFGPGWNQTIQHLAELIDSLNNEGT